MHDELYTMVRFILCMMSFAIGQAFIDKLILMIFAPEWILNT